MQEHGFGKEPKLEQGLRYNPDAIEVIVWRTIGGIWQQAHDPSWRLRPNTRHDSHAFATNKQTSGEERPETTSDQGTRPCPHSRRSSDQSWQYTDETQPTTLVQTGGGRDNKNAEHCSPVIPNGHIAEDISASVRQC